VVAYRRAVLTQRVKALSGVLLVANVTDEANRGGECSNMPDNYQSFAGSR
jgi:hypothetical protein